MKIDMITQAGTINNRFFWHNQPVQNKPKVENGRLHITTDPETDFWQKTHYGFIRDTGHALLTEVTNDFSLIVKTEFFPQSQYDQCGLIVRGNEGNWIKASTEYENELHSRLGSVVTNNGWSDWATTDVDSSIKSRWYRIQSRVPKIELDKGQSRGKDFKIEYSDLIEQPDDKEWIQLRIAHLHGDFERLSVGIYACSPEKPLGFESIFDRFSLDDSTW
jgi:hypothetical protein